MAGFAPGDFVDFVDEDDAHLLGALNGDTRDLIHIEELIFLFLDEVFESVRDGHLALFFLLTEHAGEHVLDVDVHLLDAWLEMISKEGTVRSRASRSTM